MAVWNTGGSAGTTDLVTVTESHTGVADWPALPGGTLLLGTVAYTKAQLISILNLENNGNGLLQLARQLIAAKLNILDGADPTAISATIAAADALIGGLISPPVGAGFLSPSSTSALIDALSQYNQGNTGPGRCPN